MGFLWKHRVVLGGLAIGLAGAAYQIANAHSAEGFAVNAGYVVGSLIGGVLFYGVIGGFIIWLITPKDKKANPNA